MTRRRWIDPSDEVALVQVVQVLDFDAIDMSVKRVEKIAFLEHVLVTCRWLGIAHSRTRSMKPPQNIRLLSKGRLAWFIMSLRRGSSITSARIRSRSWREA